MHELDQTILRRASQRVARGFDTHDFFCAEIRDRLLERMRLFKLEATRILELGAGTGAAAPGIQQQFPDAHLTELDWSEAMLGQSPARADRVCADAHQLPFSDACFDVALSNMMLPGCADPERVFQEARRVLKHPGVFLFSTLGPDSFKELRKAWAAVDARPHVHVFADMHNIGDALVETGFREPVMDVEHLTITYADAQALFNDLRNVGATNLLLERRRGLTSPRLWAQMLAELEKCRNAAGRLSISIEVITGQAWTGEAARGVQMVEGEAHFPLSRLRKD